jgi:hypothetical protein
VASVSVLCERPPIAHNQRNAAVNGHNSENETAMSFAASPRPCRVRVIW